MHHKDKKKNTPALEHPLLSVNEQFQYTHTAPTSTNFLISICSIFISLYLLSPHLFPFSFICCILIWLAPHLFFLYASPQNKHIDISHTQKRTGENSAPRKCNISVFNIEVYKIRAEMGSMAICLFIYFIRRGKNLPISVCIWGAWATVLELILYEK